MNSLLGMKVVVHKGYPKYLLPEEILPGLPYPKELREKINSQAAELFGTYSLIPEGEVWIIQNTIHASEKAYDRLQMIKLTNVDLGEFK